MVVVRALMKTLFHVVVIRAQNFDIVITFQIYIINIEFNRTGIVTVEHTYFSLCVVDFKTILSEPPSDHFKGSLHVLNKKVKQSVQGTT